MFRHCHAEVRRAIYYLHLADPAKKIGVSATIDMMLFYARAQQLLILLACLMATVSVSAYANPIVDQPKHAPKDARRSGFAFMSRETQTMQQDDAQNPAMLWVEEGRHFGAKMPQTARPVRVVTIMLVSPCAVWQRLIRNMSPRKNA